MAVIMITLNMNCLRVALTRSYLIIEITFTFLLMIISNLYNNHKTILGYIYVCILIQITISKDEN